MERTEGKRKPLAKAEGRRRLRHSGLTIAWRGTPNLHDCVAYIVRTKSKKLILADDASERNVKRLLAGVPAPGLVIQPENRATAPAILYGLLCLAAVAPASAVAILPSDHYVSDDDRFMAHVGAAFHAARLRPDLVILLGSVPSTPEPEYGWIEPAYAMPIEPRGRLSRVRRFL